MEFEKGITRFSSTLSSYTQLTKNKQSDLPFDAMLFWNAVKSMILQSMLFCFFFPYFFIQCMQW